MKPNRNRQKSQRVGKGSHRVLRPRAAPPTSAGDDALAIAFQSNDLERAALLLLLGVSMVVRTVSAGTIDDVLALLSMDEVLQ